MLTDMVIGSWANLGVAHIAWIVVFSAFVHRAAFGYPLMGDREKVADRVGSTVESTAWLSFEHDEAEPHLGHQFYWGEGLVLGGAVGVVSGYVAIMTGSPWLPFGISAATLLFLETDRGFRPDAARAGTVVTHQISLPAGVGALAAFTMNDPPLNPLLWGTVVALVLGVLGEFFRILTDRLFYAWSDTHLDPPAFSITITVVVLVLLSNLGIIGTNAFMPIGFHFF